MLGAQCGIQRQLLGGRHFPIGVKRLAVAAAAGDVRRLKAGKALAARIATEAHAVSIVVGAHLAGHDVVALAAVLGAEGNVAAPEQAVEIPADVKVGGGLVEPEAAGVEGRRADALAAAQQVLVRNRRIQGLVDAVAHLVAAKGLGDIGVPTGELGPPARDQGAVSDDAVNERHEPIRVHGGRVAGGDVVRPHAAARKRCGRRASVLCACRGVELVARVERQLAVQVEGLVEDLRVTNDAGVAGLGAVGPAAVLPFAGDAKARFADLHAAVERCQAVLAVAD